MIRVLLRRQPDRPNYTLYFDDPATGKEVTRSAGTPDKGEAERAAQRWERELGEWRGTEDDGWDWAKERFFDEGARGLAKSTRSNISTSLKKYAEAMSPATVSEVTTDSLSRYVAKAGDELATVAKDLRHLKRFLRWCAEVGIIRQAPRVPMPKIGKRRFMRSRGATETEYRKMLKHAPNPTWRRLIELLWLSGLRIEEAVALSWDSPPVLVRLDAKPYPQILFYGADDDGQKSGNDEAWPMPADLAEWLERTPKSKRQGLVCPLRGATNKSVENRADASKAVASIGKAAKIVTNTTTGKHASAHDLRRGFGLRWALKVPPVVLQKLMRHATIETTMKYYVNLEASTVGAVLWKGKRRTAKRLKIAKGTSGVRRRKRA